MKTIIQSDWYNALYEDGKLIHQGKPDYLSTETMLTLFPEAEFYLVPYEKYDMVLDGDGYPENLSDFPLNECNKLR